MISVEEALDRVLGAVRALGAERVPLADAAGRALAEEVISERTLPPFDNSAMDGWTVRAADVKSGVPLPIAPDIRGGAGYPPAPLPPGHAARIMTGAPIPDGADAIVMREEADEEGGRVRFRRLPAPGTHLRRAGSDVAAGATVLARGAAIGPGEIGLLAALGRTFVTVHRRPRVAIVSTGDELVEPDREPGAGQIVGSNCWALAAQCAEAGAQPTVLPIVGDDRARIRDAFTEALVADVAISSGGVSTGEFDFVKEVLGDLGVQQEFWKVRMRPGKPLAFGTRDGRPVFGLPGNPASSMVAFELFVRPALRRMLGFERVHRPRAPVLLDETYGRAGRIEPRRNYLRAQVRRDGGVLRGRPLAQQGSGMLRSMVGANALLEIPEGAGPLEAGSAVLALLLEAV